MSQPVVSPASGTCLARFAVIADTHVGPVDGVTPSPWVSNRLANDRVRAVVARVNQLAPDFVIHLGDMVHPTPDQPGYVPAANRFHQLMAPLEAPLHVIPGNHDIGDKPMVWTPAKICTDDFVAHYEALFGADHGAFTHGPMRVVMVNSQIINSGSDREAAQWAWLEAELAAHQDKRLFVFGHQPLRLVAADEAEHYDNTAEPGRGRMLDLLARYGAESWMSAHVHTFFYDREGPTDLYVLPAVSALRLDYSELFKAPPPEGDEFGRNDRDKLGFALVEVFEAGHVVHHIRTHGETLVEGETLAEGERAGSEAGLDAVGEEAFPVPGAPLLRGMPRLHPRLGGLLPIGVELRDPWAKPLEVAYSGVVDAFGRKPARDDYRLLALIETGLNRLRVPLMDVADPETRARMRTFAANGFTFSTFLFGLPDAATYALLAGAADVLSQVTIILPKAQIAGKAGELAALKRAGLKVFLSPLRSSADHGHSVEGRFAHVIDQGFEPGALGLLDEVGLVAGAVPFVDGVVFETVRGEAPTGVIEALIGATAPRGLSLSLTVKMGGANPAALTGSRADAAALACDALEAAALLPAGGEVILDTLTDIDRGYFPRFGLYDRRMNPTAASMAFARRHEAAV
ncbi:metallophosphoesterase family protein [Acuticoccus yangtzensis]|uniref:metallophosphoesterase family protein n=1 Tax=Acuticoccus yangtzensis TaxID=1443441 RepID=UPI0009499B02|nr:metallophosphoesterase [Acuticoccus yangtzensis]